MTDPAAKAEWRLRLLKARRARPPAERARAHTAITAHVLADLPGLGLTEPGLTVCAYLPMPSEPLAADLALLLAARRFRVLVPITVPHQPLDWCELSGAALVLGPFGILEPSGPRLGPGAVRDAALILVPALATDPSGFRLGRGGGFYDRTLALLGDSANCTARAGPDENSVIPKSSVIPKDTVIHGVWRVAVVFDDEVDLPIPHEAHDARVTHVVSPLRGLRAAE
ncbi:MAG: 5-formyltetrahydrofolate cyclo-ligase [Nakamurella sp.]